MTLNPDLEPVLEKRPGTDMKLELGLDLEAPEDSPVQVADEGSQSGPIDPGEAADDLLVAV